MYSDRPYNVYYIHYTAFFCFENVPKIVSCVRWRLACPASFHLMLGTCAVGYVQPVGFGSFALGSISGIIKCRNWRWRHKDIYVTNL